MVPLQELQQDFYERAYAAWWYSGKPPVNLSSYMRTRERNRLVGGHPESQHLVGLAADFTGPTQRFKQWAEYYGLVAVDEGSHLHLQRLPAVQARGLVFFIDV